MLVDVYKQMLDEFGDTLEQVSKDSDEEINPKGRGVFMTSNKKKVVNFDKFKESIAKKYALNNSPNSCDALYMQSENKWFLIEFKNGKINDKKVSQVKWKIFQSLLLLTEKIDKTICFTRENLNFILVYNEDALEENRLDEDAQRTAIGKSLYKLIGNSEFSPFGLKDLQKLYFKEVHEWTKKEFDSNFVKIYCAS
jgi:type VI protein secretion system component VasK